MKLTDITVLSTGAFAVNTVLLAYGDEAFIVDPGAEASRIRNELDRRGLKPVGILLTHAHFDHIGAVPELLTAYPALAVRVGPEDRMMIGHPLNAYPPDYPLVRGDWRYAEGAFTRGEVIPVPGHTPGGVAYYFPEDALLLSGDTLFAGSVGRTDLPGGDFATLRTSLKRLCELPPDTRIIPGHGGETQLAEELRSNPFLSHL